MSTPSNTPVVVKPRLVFPPVFRRAIAWKLKCDGSYRDVRKWTENLVESEADKIISEYLDEYDDIRRDRGL